MSRLIRQFDGNDFPIFKCVVFLDKTIIVITTASQRLFVTENENVLYHIYCH